MDKNVSDQDVLLVKSKDKPKVEVVTGTGANGSLKTTAPKKENENDFLKIDKQGNVLDNFFSNLARQYKNPSQFQFFKAPLHLVDKLSMALDELFKQPETPTNKAMLDTHRVDPANFETKKSEAIAGQDILFVKERGNPELKAVGGIENGQLKTVELDPSENNNFLKIGKDSNTLEKFCTDYTTQVKDTARYEFYKVPLDYVAKMMVLVDDWLKYPNDPACQKSLNDIRIKPEEHSLRAKPEEHPVKNKPEEHSVKAKPEEQSLKQPFRSIDESRINWSQFERLGVSRDTLEKAGSLDAMLNWQKSPVLIPIVAKFDDATLRTEARLSLRETADGKLTVGIHAIRREPELDRPYFGVKFTDEDKQALQQTGNLGRVANAEYKQGEPIPIYLSVDKLTNELVAVRADRIKIPDEIKGVKLDEQQKADLKDGKAVYLEGMTAKSGKEFNAAVQINADRKGIEFQFNDSFKKQTSQNHQQNQQSQQERPSYFIPKKLGGVDLPSEQQSKLKEGGTIYVEGMKDKKGESFNAYIKFNFEEGKPKYFQWNPDKAKEVTPDNAAKTQVAVNSEGKTNEATKSVKDPLVSGQTKPNDTQKAKEEQKQEAPKKVNKRKLS